MESLEIAAGDILIDADFHQIRLRQAEGLLQGQKQSPSRTDACRDDKFPQPPDQPDIVGFAEDLFLLERFGHLNLLQLLAQLLLLIQVGVNAAAIDQLLMSAPLDNLSLVQDQNLVRLFTAEIRCEMMRQVFSLRIFEPLQNLGFGLRVDTGKTIVENEHRWIHDQARASVALCFCPPESVTPRSPTTVLIPWGKIAKSRSSLAIPTARANSSSETSSRPKVKLRRKVVEKEMGPEGQQSPPQLAERELSNILSVQEKFRRMTHRRARHQLRHRALS